jgi:hypothetical protein
LSSTLRSDKTKEEREKIKDYYVTPVHKIMEFLNEFIKYEHTAFDGIILDPCAGGDANHPMSYPEALKQLNKNMKIHTLDIRKDSLAQVTGINYLTANLKQKPHTIITNPPFNHAEEIIEKALSDVEDNGFVIMLQRINFYGGKNRKEFWDRVGLPKYTFVHHRRISFTDDKKTDSIEYAHFVWQKGFKPEFSKLKIV